MKKRSSILKADFSTLVQVMKHEVDSLYKLSKAKFTEVFFNTMISINLRLNNSTQGYLHGLLEMTGNLFKIDSIVLLSKEGNRLSLYQVGMKDFTSHKIQSESESSLKKFDTFFGMNDSIEKQRVVGKAAQSLVHEIDSGILMDGMNVLPIFKIAKINKMQDIPIVGLFLASKVEGAISSQSIFTLFAK